MSPCKIKPDQRWINSSLGRYYRAVETKDFIYFVNYHEGDENGCTKMYRKENLELICDNYHCYNDMFCVLMDEEYTYLSPTMKSNLREYKKQNPDGSFL